MRLSQPVESPSIRPENYTDVSDLQGLDRSLTNTAWSPSWLCLGSLRLRVLGGYALARLKFPGRDQLFLVYLGTIMIPFVVLITPLYQLMVWIGWVDKLASLIIPWIFTAYGTFLMRQFFITVPKEIEEAALDRWRIATANLDQDFSARQRACPGDSGNVHLSVLLEQFFLATGYHQHGQPGKPCAHVVLEHVARQGC